MGAGLHNMKIYIVLYTSIKTGAPICKRLNAWAISDFSEKYSSAEEQRNYPIINYSLRGSVFKYVWSAPPPLMTPLFKNSRGLPHNGGFRNSYITK
jgi:hypothetical protein